MVRFRVGQGQAVLYLSHSKQDPERQTNLDKYPRPDAHKVICQIPINSNVLSAVQTVAFIENRHTNTPSVAQQMILWIFMRSKLLSTAWHIGN